MITSFDPRHINDLTYSEQQNLIRKCHIIVMFLLVYVTSLYFNAFLLTFNVNEIS